MSIEITSLTEQDISKNDIRLAFFDIDGTLLGLDGTYTQKTKEAIQRIKSRGVKTAIASGRPYFAARFIIEELGIDDPGCFCTGANVYDPVKQKSLLKMSISSSIARPLIKDLRRSELHYELYTDNHYYYEKNVIPEMLSVHTHHMRIAPELKSFDGFLAGGEEIIKFLVGCDTPEKRDQIVALEKKYPELIFAYASIASYPDWTFASIIDRSACKVSAFEKLLQIYDVTPEQVFSIGDAQSDLDFIRQAGVGVAMGNASAEIKSHADYITKPVWEDGVAYALSHFVYD